MSPTIEYITIAPNCFINQTLKCILFIVLFSNETNENSFFNFFSKFYMCKMETCQISNHLNENTFKCHCFNIQNTFFCNFF
jgi:hypothetical protein